MRHPLAARVQRLESCSERGPETPRHHIIFENDPLPANLRPGDTVHTIVFVSPDRPSRDREGLL